MSLGRDILLDAYRTMRTIRTFEDRIHVENTTGDIPGFVHLYAGQEAIATGVCCNLTDADAIGSTHRGHGHCIAKGCDVKAMMIYGKLSLTLEQMRRVVHEILTSASLTGRKGGHWFTLF